MVQEYGLPPFSENRIGYQGNSLCTKPGNVFLRAPNTNDIDYPIGFEWQYQDTASTTQIWNRVPDSTVWQFMEGSSGGVLPVSGGGTGAATLTNHGVLIGHGTSPITGLTPGTAGQVLQSAGASADPVWVNAAAGGGEGWSNLGITLTTGTLAIVGETGAAISASNPALVKIASADTPGITKTYTFTTAPATMAQTVMNTATFGTTASITWAEPMPFFIYAVIDSSGTGTETNCVFMLSRNPKAKITPGTIYKSGSAAAILPTDFFSMDATITQANFVNSPCVRVGSVRMVKDGSDAWTFQTLGSGTGGSCDGMGTYDESTYWGFPSGQNGATTGTFFSSSVGGDTKPILTGGAYQYNLGLDGAIDVLMNFTTAGTPGVGTGQLRIHIPVQNIEGNISTPPGYFSWTVTSGGARIFNAAIRNNVVNQNYYTMYNVGAGTLVSPVTIAAADQDFCFDITYQAF